MEWKSSEEALLPSNDEVDDYSLSYIVHLGRQYCSMVNQSTTEPTQGTTHQSMPFHNSSPQAEIGLSTGNFNYMNPQAILERDQDFKGGKEDHGKSTSGQQNPNFENGQQNPNFQSNPPPLISFDNGYLEINMGMDQNPSPLPCNSQNSPSLINELASLRSISSGLNMKGNTTSDGRYKSKGILMVEKDLVKQKNEESGGVCALKVDDDDFDFLDLEDFFMTKDRFGFDV